MQNMNIACKIYIVLYKRIYMHRFEISRSTEEFTARTLLITDIPKHQSTVEILTEYFKYVEKEFSLIFFNK